MTIRCLVASSQPMIRIGMGMALSDQLDAAVTECASIQETLATLDSAATTADVLVVDMDLEERSGALRVCRELTRELPVLVRVDDHDDSELLAALAYGAIGFVSQQGGIQELVRSVEAASAGEACVPRRLLGGLLRALVARQREATELSRRFQTLTNREREILTFLARGMDISEISRETVTSKQTVRTHVQKLITKLGVHSRREAVAIAIDHNLLQTEP